MSKRDPNDYYPTPIELCVPALGLLDLNPRQILDAGAGDGNWGMAARARWPGAYITGVEIRSVPRPAAYTTWRRADFRRFRDPSGIRYDLIVMNPPFKYAMEFIVRAHDLLAEGGTIAALLRLSFVESEERYPFWQHYPLHRQYPIVGRPSFDGIGEDSIGYALFLWRPSGDHPFRWIRWEKQRAKQRIALAAAGAVQESLL